MERPPKRQILPDSPHQNGPNTPRLRLGAVRYLNTVPLIAGLSAHRETEVVLAVPSAIAPMVESGRVDMGLVSVIDAARSPAPLAVLSRAGMIGSEGRTMTVRVFSRVPPSQITTLHADTDSHASTALAQVILAKAHSVRPKVVDFDAREFARTDAPWPETVLLIGDKVVTGSPPAVRYEHQIDLGQAWHDLTGLPCVYAVWVCLASRAGDPLIRSSVDLLDRQRRRNAVRADHLITTAAGERAWPGDLAREYVGERLRYDLDDRAREGASRFIALAHELGLSPAGELRWAGGAAGAV